MKVTILLADDHTIVRQGLHSMLSKNAEFDVVGEAKTGVEAIQLARELSPDIIIMDIGMPEMNGIEATRQILEENPDTKVIALSMHNDKNFVAQMLKAGASGYLLKDSIFQNLIVAIRSVLENKCYLSPAVAKVVIEDYTVGQTPADDKIEEEPVFSKPAPDPDLANLTRREREVLKLLAEGKTSKQIADQLFISAKTVENHRNRIMQKLSIHSIAELTKYAIRHGLTQLR